MQLMHIPQNVCQVLIPHNPTHNVAGISIFFGRAHPYFYRGTTGGPTLIRKKGGPTLLNKKGVPTLPFID